MKKHYLLLALFVISALVCNAQNPTLWGYAAAGNAPNSGDYYLFKTNDTGKVTYEHQFGSGKDGLTPEISLMKASNGLLYGVASEGGNSDVGIIFSFNISTDLYSIVYNFIGYPSDGGFPDGPLMQASDGLLYGITTNGGAYQYGTIYSFNTATGIETDVHDFSNGDTDGYYPQTCGLIQVGDSLLYGTTADGGTDSVGTIFSYNIFTHKETDIYNFVSGRGVGTGCNPVTSLIQASNGLLYGATESGGGNGVGTLFSYNISTHSYSDLYDFGGAITNGSGSGSLIQARDSLLYGLTASGGNYYRGMIYSYNIYSNVYRDIHDFGNNTDGQNPYGALMKASNGLFYGLTQEGGINSNGTIFSFNDTTKIETDIHDFSFTDTAGDDPDGNLIEDDSFVVANTPVWPGDANDDLTVNVYDLLSLGLYYDETGPARDTTDIITWAPHPAANWGVSQYNGYDLKYADCNGDGIININDAVAILLNYNDTHPSHSARGSSKERSGGVPLYFIADSTSYHGGSNVHVAVWLGSSTNPATNIYGLGYDIAIDTSLIQSGTLIFDNDSSFIGTTTDTSALAITHIGDDVEAAVVGTNHTDKSGYGKIGDLYFTLSSSITNPQFLISVSDWQAIDAGGNMLTLQPASDTLNVTTGIKQLSANNGHLIVYPNPSSGVFYIQAPSITDGKWNLYDMLGQQVALGELNSSQTQLNFSLLPQGIYVLNFSSQQLTVNQKISIVK